MLKATYSVESLSSGAVCADLSEGEAIALLEGLDIPFADAAKVCRDVYMFSREPAPEDTGLDVDYCVRSVVWTRDDRNYLVEGELNHV